jgi:hypothetical protein
MLADEKSCSEVGDRYCVGDGGKMRLEKGKLGLSTKPLLCIY